MVDTAVTCVRAERVTLLLAGVAAPRRSRVRAAAAAALLLTAARLVLSVYSTVGVRLRISADGLCVAGCVGHASVHAIAAPVLGRVHLVRLKVLNLMGSGYM